MGIFDFCFALVLFLSEIGGGVAIGPGVFINYTGLRELIPSSVYLAPIGVSTFRNNITLYHSAASEFSHWQWGSPIILLSSNSLLDD